MAFPRLHIAAAVAIVFLSMGMAASAWDGMECPKFEYKNMCKCGGNEGVVQGGFLKFVKPMWWGKVASQKACCRKCKVRDGCSYFTFDRSCNICKLYHRYACDCKKAFVDSYKTIVTGGPCNPECKDDPHFVGAHGVKYDFNGVPDESFCLITDKNIHVNMRITGYYADDKEKSLRSWIKELVFFWRVGEEKHTLSIIARSGSAIERQEGFISQIVFNGAPLGRMQPEDVFSHPESGLTLTMKPVSKLGEYEVDTFDLSIEGLIQAAVQARVAHKLLRLVDDAETHLNLRIADISNTDDIHGVLGQTYRLDREERTEKFQKLADILHASIHADREDGKGFLDGDLEDYETHDVLSTGCSFDRFNAVSAEVVEDTA